MKITGDGVYGVFTNDADVQVRDAEVTGDLATALRVDEGGGRLICRDCSIDVTSPDDDGIIGLVEESGSLEINDSDLAGSGLAAFDGSDLLCTGGSDASCADPASNVTGGVSGCSLCTP